MNMSKNKKNQEAQKRKAKEADKMKKQSRQEDATEKVNQNNIEEQANQEQTCRGGGNHAGIDGVRQLPPANENGDNQAHQDLEPRQRPPQNDGVMCFEEQNANLYRNEAQYQDVQPRQRPLQNDGVVCLGEQNANRYANRNEGQYYGQKQPRFNYNRTHFYKNRTWEKPPECRDCARLRRERNEVVTKNSELQLKLAELTAKLQQLETESKMKEMVNQLMNERAAAMQTLAIQRQQMAYQY